MLLLKHTSKDHTKAHQNTCKHQRTLGSTFKTTVASPIGWKPNSWDVNVGINNESGLSSRVEKSQGSFSSWIPMYCHARGTGSYDRNSCVHTYLAELRCRNNTARQPLVTSIRHYISSNHKRFPVAGCRCPIVLALKYNEPSIFSASPTPITLCGTIE